MFIWDVTGIGTWKTHVANDKYEWFQFFVVLHRDGGKVFSALPDISGLSIGIEHIICEFQKRFSC